MYYTLEAFSKLSSIPIETIEVYKQAGLLTPVNFCNEKLYTTNELLALHNIMAFSQMGFTQDEIAGFIDGSPQEVDLQIKKEQITRKIKRLNRKVSDLDDYLLEAGECNIVIKALPEITVASKDVTVSSRNELFAIADMMRNELARLNCQIAETAYNFIAIHGDKLENESLQVRLCIAVSETKENTDTFCFKNIPAISRVACSYHTGEYSSINLTHSFSALWMEYHDYLIDGDFREVYIDGSWNKDTSCEFLTEIQVPLM